MSKYESAIQKFTSRIDIFWCSPTSSTSGGGRLSQGGKEKFVTRLAFRRARSQQRSEQAQTSLKAYRVEFVEPLTECPGTENGKGEHQKATQCPNKSKINFSKPAKKKPLSSAVA